MPNISSAKKRLRQSLVRRARNRAVKAKLRSHIKKVRSEIEAGNVEEATVAFRTAQIRLDQAAGKRVIHKNAAARVKSRLSAAILAVKKTARAG
jgi:small subunit ribosomal protein S20